MLAQSLSSLNCNKINMVYWEREAFRTAKNHVNYDVTKQKSIRNEIKKTWYQQQLYYEQKYIVRIA